MTSFLEPTSRRSCSWKERFYLPVSPVVVMRKVSVLFYFYFRVVVEIVEGYK